MAGLARTIHAHHGVDLLVVARPTFFTALPLLAYNVANSVSGGASSHSCSSCCCSISGASTGVTPGLTSRLYSVVRGEDERLLTAYVKVSCHTSRCLPAALPHLSVESFLRQSAL
jgi:hypothetical protein